jgi:leucyl/phenylalanyl-tRNA--protein transferase
MAVVFPPLHSASEEGLLAIGGDLELETLLTAYTQGIFPWPVSDDSPLTWFSPDPRGLLEFSDLHTSRSFQRFLRNTNLTVSFNQNFTDVITTCANIKRKHESGTWISQEIIDGYTEMFNNGFAYCVEIKEDETLVGGLYGICIGELISGESMFHTVDNASKLAIHSLVKKVQSKGVKWIDTQMVTPIIESFGGKEIPREKFINKINDLNFTTPTRAELFS